MILVTGATGFVGSHLIKRLRQSGLPVRTLVRRPDRAAALKDLGAELAAGDISDRQSLDAAISGCDRVIHLVGIIQELPGATFRSVHVEGTANVLEAAKKAGIRLFLHQSALGTRPDAKSEYHRTKWEAEELVRASGLGFTIFRPSLIYGPGDQFTIRLADMIRMSPVLPIIGSGRSKVQPIFIDDLTACIEKAITTDCCLNKAYELGGPEQLTYEEVSRMLADAMGVKRPSVHLPLGFMRLAATAFETLTSRPPVTQDQLIMLQEDNICDSRTMIETFKIDPVKFQDGIRTFINPR